MNRSFFRLIAGTAVALRAAAAVAAPVMQEPAHVDDTVVHPAAAGSDAVHTLRPLLAKPAPLPQATVAATVGAGVTPAGLPGSLQHDAPQGAGHSVGTIDMPAMAAGSSAGDSTSHDMQIALWRGSELMLASALNRRVLDTAPRPQGGVAQLAYQPASGAMPAANAAAHAQGLQAAYGVQTVEPVGEARGNALHAEVSLEPSAALPHEPGLMAMIWRWLRALRSLLNG